ncbi:hypothetical protein I7I48_00051 [Histoplasma ohiense]|nr:hypothetical protein I7I48_00051 [Histoplasma ohiense (nom. inval.)]
MLILTVSSQSCPPASRSLRSNSGSVGSRKRESSCWKTSSGVCWWFWQWLIQGWNSANASPSNLLWIYHA